MKPVDKQLSNGTSIMCKSIVERPRLGIRNKLCLCNNGKWQPLGYGGGDGQVDVQFFGDILGAAKQLCALFKSIDCIQRDGDKVWIVEDTTDFELVGPAQPTKTSRQGLVELTGSDGENGLIKEDDLMEVVDGICKFIDDGAGTLPGLLPGIIPGGGIDGIFGWLGRLLDGLFDFFDVFGNGVFKGRTVYHQV